MDDSGLTKGRKPVIAHDQTKKFTTDSNINLATRQTSILDKGTPRPWRIGITILSMGIQIILDLTENVAIGRSYPETEMFQGIDLSPFNAYDLGISRRHALLALDGDRVVIVDNDSANGTLLNGERLKPGQQYSLRNGDHLKLGMMDLKIELLLNPFELA
ncbi:MAG: hypothetical protein CL607_16390 [Anaerolineaceae bacterium]|nr:hypothetical protein [Anaerolineaceae bacterium]